MKFHLLLISMIPAALDDDTAPIVTPDAPNLASVKDDIAITSPIVPESLDVPDPSAPLNTILLLVVPAAVIEFSSIVQPAITPDPVARILGRLTTEVSLPNEPDSICCIPSALKFVEEDIADVCDLIVDACDCNVLA